MFPLFTISTYYNTINILYLNIVPPLHLPKTQLVFTQKT